MNDTAQTRSGLRMWVRVVFGISLALNLLVIGLVVGAVIRFGGMDGQRPPPSSMGAAMYRELPPEDRQVLRANARSRANHSTESRLAEVEAIATALRADPFDKDAVKAVLDEQARHRIDWQESAQAAWLDRVLTMSVADRVEFAERLRQSVTHHRGSDHHATGHWWKRRD